MEKNTVQTKQWPDKCYGESSPSRQMVQKWIGVFKPGRINTNDAEQSGKPIDVLRKSDFENKFWITKNPKARESRIFGSLMLT